MRVTQMVPTHLTTKMIAIAVNMLVFYAVSLENSLLARFKPLFYEGFEELDLIYFFIADDVFERSVLIAHVDRGLLNTSSENLFFVPVLDSGCHRVEHHLVQALVVVCLTTIANLLVHVSILRRIVCEFTVEQHFSLSSSGSFASDSIDATMSSLARLRFVTFSRKFVVTWTTTSIVSINTVGFHDDT